jgi:hypothetical protein
MLIYPQTHAHLDVPLPAQHARTTASAHRYDDLFAALKQAKGDWVAIADLTTVAGHTIPKKASILHGAAKQRRLRIRTTAQHGLLYCRLVKHGLKAVA